MADRDHRPTPSDKDQRIPSKQRGQYDDYLTGPQAAGGHGIPSLDNLDKYAEENPHPLDNSGQWPVPQSRPDET